MVGAAQQFYAASMDIFIAGQKVRIKDSQWTGTVAQKLTSLQDVYAVQLDGKPTPEERLVRGADLLPLTHLAQSSSAA